MVKRIVKNVIKNNASKSVIADIDVSKLSHDEFLRLMHQNRAQKVILKRFLSRMSSSEKQRQLVKSLPLVEKKLELELDQKDQSIIEGFKLANHREPTQLEYLNYVVDEFAGTSPEKSQQLLEKHSRFFRSVIKMLIKIKKIDRIDDVRALKSVHSIVTRKYGCLNCPYKGTNICPYGIGRRVAEQDQKDSQGFLVNRKGEVLQSHPNYICDERLSEFHIKMKNFNQLTGLKEERAKNLMEMSDTLKLAKDRLNELIELQKQNESAADKGIGGSHGAFLIDPKTQDVSLKTALLQLDTMMHRYQEQLNHAIKQEEGVKQVIEKRVSADDISHIMGKARQILAKNKDNSGQTRVLSSTSDAIHQTPTLPSDIPLPPTTPLFQPKPSSDPFSLAPIVPALEPDDITDDGPVFEGKHNHIFNEEDAETGLLYCACGLCKQEYESQQEEKK